MGSFENAALPRDVSRFTQQNRLFRLGPTPAGMLLLDRFQGTEGLSEPFRFTLQLLSERADPRDRLESEAGTDQDRGPLPRLEQYEYPGSFAYDGPDDGTRRARLRVQELDLRGRTHTGVGTCRFLTCGHTFTLLDPYGLGDDTRFLVTRVDHEGGNKYRGHPGLPSYRNSFACIPARVPFRPSRATPRPARWCRACRPPPWWARPGRRSTATRTAPSSSARPGTP